MCLGTVCQVVSAPTDGFFTARGSGRDVTVSTLTLTDPVTTGDWVLVHCGLALARLSEAEALDAIALRDSEVSP